jgi:hypothetical protein
MASNIESSVLYKVGDLRLGVLVAPDLGQVGETSKDWKKLPIYPIIYPI